MKLVVRIIPLEGLSEVKRLEPRVFRDERGWFYESFKQSELTGHGIGPFVQQNHSRSNRGVVRGLHYQLAPHAQGKLVRCVAGALHDVVVDIRRGSPTFQRRVELTLRPDGVALWIPPGFAHGFQALEEGTEMLYLVSVEYDAPSERVIAWNDPELAIKWPLPPAALSTKDASAPILRRAELPS